MDVKKDLRIKSSVRLKKLQVCVIEFHDNCAASIKQLFYDKLKKREIIKM